jgi:acid phosphatase type 7
VELMYNGAVNIITQLLLKGENSMPNDNQDQTPQSNQGASSQKPTPSSHNPMPTRRFGNPVARRISPHVVRTTQEAHPNVKFEPLPQPTGPQPYHLSLDQVLPDKIAAINAAGQLVFHIVGDTGGVKTPAEQRIVAMHMLADCEGTDPATQPAFFYHLGDVVYYNGEDDKYYDQFYEPYNDYPQPIFAIPGNHDGDPINNTVRSLDAFVANFCSPTPVIRKEAGEYLRYAMTQPNVYWTFEAPFVTIIGLYTNVPEGGEVHDDQAAWFTSELANAPTDKALLVALHHPIYSADRYHSGSDRMGQLLEQAIDKTGRIPDAVFAGHVHNYQRFTRSLNGRDIPFIVAGAGGYWNLHYMVKGPDGETLQTPYPLPELNVTLESYCDDHHGYMRLEVTPQTLKGEYFAVPRPQESWNAPAQLTDSFTLDLKQHRLVPAQAG